MSTDKAALQEEIDTLIKNIKALTKLLIDKYDPLQTYDQELMAICSTQCRALYTLRARLSDDNRRDYQTLFDDLLIQTFKAFATIIGMKPEFVEAQYFDFIDASTTNW